MAAAFEKVKARDPNQTEFLQAVEEVFDSLGPLFDKYPHYVKVRDSNKDDFDEDRDFGRKKIFKIIQICPFLSKKVQSSQNKAILPLGFGSNLRTRASHSVPSPLAGRQQQNAGEPRFPSPIQPSHR